MIPIVLASASPRRRALLEALGIDFTVRPSDAPETLDGIPRDVALHNAADKRDDVSRRLSHPALVIGADTIVVLEGRIMGKPADLDEARSMLARLSGKTHEVLTAVAVINTETGDKAEGIEGTQVTFRTLTEDHIARFVEAVRPLDRAGAYTVDGPGSMLVARYEGCYQNVLGLPIVLLDTLLTQLGDGLLDRMRADAARFL